MRVGTPLSGCGAFRLLDGTDPPLGPCRPYAVRVV